MILIYVNIQAEILLFRRMINVFIFRIGHNKPNQKAVFLLDSIEILFVFL